MKIYVDELPLWKDDCPFWNPDKENCGLWLIDCYNGSCPLITLEA